MDKQWKLPTSGKHVYTVINFLLLAALYGSITFLGMRTPWPAFAAAAFFLFNGFWSISRKRYSWVHREDPSMPLFRFAWALFIALGVLLIGIGAVVLVLCG